MVLPISGNSINLMNVQLEYGGSEPISLNEYYGFGSAPSSGAISLGDFLQTGTQASAISSGLLFELDARNSGSYSDINLKDNIEVISDPLKKIQSIRGVTYTRKDLETNAKFTGVIAQEVEEVLPEVVQTNEDGIKSVAYGNMVGLLIESIKEQQKTINMLKDEVENLNLKLGE